MSTRNTPGGEAPSSANTKMAPPKDAGVVEAVASPLATLSSHLDPWPHYIMSAACEFLLRTFVLHRSPFFSSLVVSPQPS